MTNLREIQTLTTNEKRDFLVILQLPMVWASKYSFFPALFLLLLFFTSLGASIAISDEPPKGGAPLTVTQLQQFRTSESQDLRTPDGQLGQVILTNLNPSVNVWYLLTLESPSGKLENYHLENPLPQLQTITLDPAYHEGVKIRSHGNDTCLLWPMGSRTVLNAARTSGKNYAPLCKSRLYLRNPTQSHKTNLEWTTDFLRRYVPGGEAITTFVHKKIMVDSHLRTSELIRNNTQLATADTKKVVFRPVDALIDPGLSDRSVEIGDFDISFRGGTDNKMKIGRWYDTDNSSGVYVSAIVPKAISHDIFKQHSKALGSLDQVESKALSYLIAFDLSKFELNFTLGTEHPTVDWSDRVGPAIRKSGPGPDGISNTLPLIRSGLISPTVVPNVVATFTGGFKRYHGAFKWGDLAFKNYGSHYGFIENGVVLSKLQPQLSTVIIFNDGSVELKTWSDADNARLKNIKHARQNGVPLVEFDDKSKVGVPGSLLTRFGDGNWSGSVEGRFRTLRSGICLQENHGQTYLIYGFFSSATPSAMAATFLSYQCKYAMQLDMNALEHTYLALYRLRDEKTEVQHLVKGMEVLDLSRENKVVPRFIGYADNRDFFYLVRKNKALH